MTDEAIKNAYVFYEMWYEAPGAVKVSPVWGCGVIATPPHHSSTTQ